jgi:hypothetical protein
MRVWTAVTGFLGHKVQADGISPLADKVKAIRDFPKPSTAVEMQAFLGLFNSLVPRRHIRAAYIDKFVDN